MVCCRLWTRAEKRRSCRTRPPRTIALGHSFATTRERSSVWETIPRGLACGNTSFYVAGTGFAGRASPRVCAGETCGGPPGETCAGAVVSADWRDINLQIRVNCFREKQVRWILTRVSNQHRFSGQQEVCCLSNMPGEERSGCCSSSPHGNREEGLRVWAGERVC